MDRVHRISLDGSRLTMDDRTLLNTLAGVDTSINRRNFFVTIDDDDPRWPDLSQLVRRLGGSDRPTKRFTDGERNVAEWLATSPVSYHGHPGIRPIRDRLGEFFDSPSGDPLCPHCETGRQRTSEPLPMAGEPHWERSDFLQIDALRDLWFARPEVYATVFEPLGVLCRPVVNRRTGESLCTIVELVPQRTNVPLSIPSDDSGAEPLWISVHCGVCGAVGFEIGAAAGWLPGDRVIPAPAAKLPPGFHFVTTQERWTAATKPECRTWSLVLISQTLFQRLRHHTLRGIACEPTGWEEW